MQTPLPEHLTSTRTFPDEESGRIELSLEECSQDSLLWCRRLLQESPDDPVILRRIIEGYKIRTIQDMNLVRRIVRKAESDHYALYRAYKLLKDSTTSSTGSNGSVGQEIMGEDVISILLEHLPEDRHQTFTDISPSPSTTPRQIRASS
ncbi:protein Njmu-R1-like [Tropilaelaps mercedesae]|uniref:Protein Njmu-R1-like n=1 Tax=Tropilaelaps mercedesae TaxID=418985 RepID=A0A1V9XSC7_9ACAR|nr:protein Njmu-R1-like [Tropilaelaps mercedesae]